MDRIIIFCSGLFIICSIGVSIPSAILVVETTKTNLKNEKLGLTIDGLNQHFGRLGLVALIIAIGFGSLNAVILFKTLKK